MRRSQLVTVLVVTTIIVGILSVYSADNRVSATIVKPAVDTTSGSHQINSVSNTYSTSITITPSATNEIIYATVYSASGKDYTLSISSPSSPSSPSLSWNNRGDKSTSYGEMAAWWAVSSSTQPITITFSSDKKTSLVVSAFCVLNADTTKPFELDTFGYNSDKSTVASASITTTNPHCLVVGAVAFSATSTITIGDGCAEITNTGRTSPSGASEYLITSAEGENTLTFSGNDMSWVEIVDAFVPASKSITISSSPQTGAGFITVNGITQTTPYTARYTPGTVLAISAISPVSGGTGTRHVFSSWSDGLSQTHDYTVQSASETITANYQTQYQINFAQTGLDSTVASTTLTGQILNVNGTSIHYASLPYSIWVNSGDRLVYTYNATCASTTTGKQFSLSTVSATSPLTDISSSQTVTATYQTQYQVTFASNPSDSGSIDQANGYFTTGSLTVITATANGDYIFNHWSNTGSISFTDTTTATTTMTVNGIGTVTAHFTQKAITSLTIASNLETVDKGNPLTISGTLTSEGTTLSGKTIVISYYNGTHLLEVGTTLTQADGIYQYVWMVPASLPNGQYIIKADFEGDSQFLDCSSADSGGNLSVNVLPEYAFGGLTAMIICLAAMMFFSKRSKAPKSIVN
jgi:hypothetical protein